LGDKHSWLSAISAKMMLDSGYILVEYSNF